MTVREHLRSDVGLGEKSPIIRSAIVATLAIGIASITVSFSGGMVAVSSSCIGSGTSQALDPHCGRRSHAGGESLSFDRPVEPTYAPFACLIENRERPMSFRVRST